MALPPIVPDDEEGGSYSGALEEVQEFGRVDVRPVIEGQGKLARDRAMADVDAIRDIPEQRTGYFGRVTACWCLIPVACRPE